MTTSRFRWIVLATLTLITILNFVDRQTFSVLYPIIGSELHFGVQTYSLLVTIFLLSYMCMYVIGGWLMDQMGARNGLALALVWWSIATILGGFAHNAATIGASRILMALAEPMVFPAGLKVCAEFFPERQRALATGVFSSGSGLGALLATPLISTLSIHMGWRLAIILPGIAGLIVTPLWMHLYRRLARTQAHSTVSNWKPYSWRQLFLRRTTWALILPRAFVDPLWYVCLFWVPTYLQQGRHVSLQQLALFGWVPYLFAAIGNVLGGTFSDALIQRGWNPLRARTAILVGTAIFAPCGALIGLKISLPVCIFLIVVIALISQVWTTTTSALAADITPTGSLGVLSGTMGAIGGLGGAIFSAVGGPLVQRFGYPPLFSFASFLALFGGLTLASLLFRARKELPPCSV